MARLVILSAAFWPAPVLPVPVLRGVAGATRGWYGATAITPRMLEGCWLRPDPDGAAGQPGAEHAPEPWKYATAIHCAEAGGVGMAQVTVQAPPAAMTAAGETSHSPGRLSMMNTSAPGGWSCTVPVHRYRRPGGGGKDCSTRPVMSTEGAGGDPLGMRFMSATAMLAIAATAAARSTCQRSRRCCCFLRGRVPMGHSVPSQAASGQVLGGAAAHEATGGTRARHRQRNRRRHHPG